MAATIQALYAAEEPNPAPIGKSDVTLAAIPWWPEDIDFDACEWLWSNGPLISEQYR